MKGEIYIMKKKLTIEGMKCDGCADTVLQCLKSIEGVTEASVNLENKSALVESHNEVSDQAIYESLANEKYKVVKITEA